MKPLWQKYKMFSFQVISKLDVGFFNFQSILESTMGFLNNSFNRVNDQKYCDFIVTYLYILIGWFIK